VGLVFSETFLPPPRERNPASRGVDSLRFSGHGIFAPLFSNSRDPDMPDLTVHAYWHCMSWEHWQTQVASSNGKESYTVTWGLVFHGPYERDWSCTCKAFQFKHTCKHIDQVKDQRCGWDQHMDGGDRTSSGECPQCHGPVGAHTVGV